MSYHKVNSLGEISFVKQATLIGEPTPTTVTAPTESTPPIPGLTASAYAAMSSAQKLQARAQFCGGELIIRSGDAGTRCATVTVIHTEGGVANRTWNQVKAMTAAQRKALCPPGKVVTMDPNRKNAAGENMAQCIQGPRPARGSDLYLELMCRAQGNPEMQRHADDAGVPWRAEGNISKELAELVNKHGGIKPIRSINNCVAAVRSKTAQRHTIETQIQNWVAGAVQFSMNEQGIRMETTKRIQEAGPAPRDRPGGLSPRQEHRVQMCRTLGLPEKYLGCCEQALSRGDGESLESYALKIQAQDPGTMACLLQVDADEKSAKTKKMLLLAGAAVGAFLIGSKLLKKKGKKR